MIWKGRTMQTRHMLAYASLLVGVAALFRPDPANAQTSVGSSSDPCSGIPNCVLQPQATIHFGASDTKGWAFYCSGDNPYYWGEESAGDYNRWTQNNNCFTTSESGGSELGNPTKLDVTITNWCVKDEDYNISIACSSNPPPNYAPACGSSNPSEPIFTDPKCPIQGNIQNSCAQVPAPVCIQSWTEQCSNNIQYWCTLDIYLGLTECVACTD